VKKKIVEKPPRNSAGFCGGGQGLSRAVEPRNEESRRILNGFPNFYRTSCRVPFLGYQTITSSLNSGNE
jgi:hypothetical protein